LIFLSPSLCFLLKETRQIIVKLFLRLQIFVYYINLPCYTNFKIFTDKHICPLRRVFAQIFFVINKFGVQIYFDDFFKKCALLNISTHRDHILKYRVPQLHTQICKFLSLWALKSWDYFGLKYFLKQISLKGDASWC